MKVTLEYIRKVKAIMTKKKIGIYAGSFDPLTHGHIDIIRRASKIFDELIVLIAINTSKKTWFTAEERVLLTQQAVDQISNVRVDTLRNGLIANYYHRVGASALVRGIRNSTDFEYEYGIASANKKQCANLDTVVLFASDQYRYLSSSLIKEIAYFDGDITDMVPENVNQAMQIRKKELALQQSK